MVKVISLALQEGQKQHNYSLYFYALSAEWPITAGQEAQRMDGMYEMISMRSGGN